MKDEKEFRENCAAYVLDALEKKEKEEFELFLQQADKEYLEILRAYRDTVTQIPLAVRQRPPEHLRQQILDAVHKRSQHSAQKNQFVESRIGKLHRSLGLHKPATGLTTLAALLLLGFGLLIYNYMLHQHIGEQHETVVELHDELNVMGEYLSILESRQLEYVRLDGSDLVTAAFGKLICDLNRKRALLQVSNLPALPYDKSYYLWVVKNGHVVNQGSVDIRENRIHNLFLFKEFEIEDVTEMDDVLFTITLESAETGSRGAPWLNLQQKFV